MSDTKSELQLDQTISIPSGRVKLEGELKLPKGSTGIVLFAHGSGSSRHSPRNQYVAQVIRKAGVGTLLFDLLTKEEEAIDAYTGELRFDIAFLGRRLVDATNWVTSQPATQHLRIGYFGSSTGAAAALIAAVELTDIIAAVVSRGGRPDLAGNALAKVTAPTLLIVGGNDDVVIRLADPLPPLLVAHSVPAFRKIARRLARCRLRCSSVCTRPEPQAARPTTAAASSQRR